MFSRVTVIGANGTMGTNVAAMFASFGGAEVYMISRSIEKSRRAVDAACVSVKAESIKKRLIPLDYESLEECVKKSNLIFEACAEDWGIKEKIHLQVAEFLGDSDEKMICTGTSGLSITGLAELYSEKARRCFFGVHFFNPPYNMTLCELIPTVYTDERVLDQLDEYLSKQLRRTTVRVADQPAFLANRIGFQFINEALQMAEKYKYNGGIDYIDAILGAFTGRNMAPLVTANFVGLDVHKAIVDNLKNNTNDYANDTFILPEYVQKLISEGKLGRKSGVGLYKTVVHDDGTKTHQVYDIEHGEYRTVRKYTFAYVEEMLESLRVGDYKNAYRVLCENKSQEALLCCHFLVKYVLYSIYVANEVAEHVSSADAAMATGFNWCPPMALVSAFGGKENFISLCQEILTQDEKEKMKFEILKEEICNSSYDFRKFIKAKE